MHILHRIFPNMRTTGWLCMYCREQRASPILFTAKCNTLENGVATGDFADLFGWAAGVQPPPP